MKVNLSTNSIAIFMYWKSIYGFIAKKLFPIKCAPSTIYKITGILGSFKCSRKWLKEFSAALMYSVWKFNSQLISMPLFTFFIFFIIFFLFSPFLNQNEDKTLSSFNSTVVCLLQEWRPQQEEALKVQVSLKVWISFKVSLWIRKIKVQVQIPFQIPLKVSCLSFAIVLE